MAFTTPTVRATTDLISSAIWNADIVANINWLATDAPYARVYNSANQSIANATQTALAFNSERFDNASMHDTSTNNSRLIATVAGKYVVGGGGRFAINVTGPRFLTIRKNSVTEIAQDGRQAITGGIYPTPCAAPSPFDSFAAAEWAELYAFQDSGGALNVETQANISPELWMYLIRI